MTIQHAIRFLKQDRKLAKIIDRVGDFQIKKRNNHFAALVEAIISQQLTSAAADAIIRRFKKLYPISLKARQGLNIMDSIRRKSARITENMRYLKDLAK